MTWVVSYSILLLKEILRHPVITISSPQHVGRDDVATLTVHLTASIAVGISSIGLASTFTVPSPK